MDQGCASHGWGLKPVSRFGTVRDWDLSTGLGSCQWDWDPQRSITAVPHYTIPYEIEAKVEIHGPNVPTPQSLQIGTFRPQSPPFLAQSPNPTFLGHIPVSTRSPFFYPRPIPCPRPPSTPPARLRVGDGFEPKPSDLSSCR